MQLAINDQARSFSRHMNSINMYIYMHGRLCCTLYIKYVACWMWPTARLGLNLAGALQTNVFNFISFTAVKLHRTHYLFMSTLWRRNFARNPNEVNPQKRNIYDIQIVWTNRRVEEHIHMLVAFAIKSCNKRS